MGRFLPDVYSVVEPLYPNGLGVVQAKGGTVRDFTWRQLGNSARCLPLCPGAYTGEVE